MSEGRVRQGAAPGARDGARLTARLLRVVLLALALGSATSLEAQYRFLPPSPATPLEHGDRRLQARGEPNHGGMLLGGVLGGALGFGIGMYAGAAMIEDEAGFFFGAIAGQALLLPTGVHLGNRIRGTLLPALITSAALGAGGTWLAFQTDGPIIAFGMVPLFQLITSIAIESATTK